MAAVELDTRHVRIVDRCEDDHLVAGPDTGGDGGIDRLGRPRRYGNFGVRVIGGEVEPRHLFRDGLAQGGHSGHRRILIGARRHVMGHAIEQSR
jgi:hypothetical protein